MKKFFLILFFTIPLIQSFSCPDIDKKSFCEASQGCSWSKDNNECSGDIEDLNICKDVTCIYFWKNATKSTKEDKDGSLQKPYSSLETVLKNLNSKTDYILVAINLDKIEYELKPYDFGEQNITIQPFYDMARMYLKFAPIDYGRITLSIQTQLKIKNANLVLDFDDVEVEDKTSIFEDQRDKKEIEESECQLSILDSNLTTANSAQIITDTKLADFTYCSFSIKNTTFISQDTIQIIKLLGLKSLKSKPRVEIKSFVQNFNHSDILLQVKNAKIDINDYYVEKQDHDAGVNKEIYLFFMDLSELIVNGLVLKGTSQNVFNLRDSQINFKNSQFYLISAYRIFNIPPSQNQDIRRANFTNVTFTAILVDHQMFYLGLNTKLSQIKIDALALRKFELYSYIKTGACLLSYFSEVEIEDSSFANFTDTCIFLHYSSLKVSNSIFYGKKTQPNYLEKYVFHYPEIANQLSSSIITLDVSEYVLDSLIPKAQNVTIKNTQFVSFVNFVNSGGALTASPSQNIDRYISVTDCIFLGMFATETGGSISLDNHPMAKISNSIFSQQGYKTNITNLTINGGALTLQGSQIDNCIFTNLQSKINGGAVEFYNSQFKDNIFHQNSASFGGALSSRYFKHGINHTNQFIFNQAKVRGGAILSTYDSSNLEEFNSTYPNFDQNGLSSNFTMYKPDYVINTYKFNSNWNLIGKDKKFTKVFENKTELFQLNQTRSSRFEHEPAVNISYKYGQQFSELIELKLYKVNSSKISYDFDGLEVCLVLLHYMQGHLRECSNIYKGKVYFTGLDMQIQMKNITQFKSDLKKEQVKSGLDLQLGIDISVNYFWWAFITTIEFCAEGDHIVDTEKGICEPCPQYTYSIQVPNSLNDTCLPCPDNMICAGGNDVLPLPGYYRPSLSSIKAVECLNEMACIGGIKEDQIISRNGFCKDKFRGVLCSQCESGYIPTQNSSSCIECENDVLFYLKMIGMMIITLGIVLVQIYLKFRTSRRMALAYQKNDKNLLENIEKTNSFSNSFKIIVTLFQMISIIKAINFQWITSLKYFYNLSSDILPTIVRQFAQKCLLVFLGVDSRFMQYYQYIMILSTPFINLFWISIIAILYFLIKRRGRRSENSESFEQFNIKSVLFQAIIILFYIYQPSILIETFNLFSCRKLSEKYYFIQNLDVECYDSTYFKWVLILGIPQFIFWALIIPISLYLKISKEFKMASKDGNEELNLFRSKYSFIVSSFKSEYYYWEFLISLRKIAMILLVSLLALSDTMTQGLIILIIIGISVYIQVKFDPYTNESLSKLDKASMATIFVMIQLGIYMENETIIKNGQIVTNNPLIIYILSLVGALLLLYCCFLFIELVYQAYWGKVKGKVNNIWKRGKNSLELQDSSRISQKEGSAVL